jgi:Tol biopolymer transport system component
MKKILIFIVIVIVSQITFAQKVTILENRIIAKSTGEGNYFPTISSDGSKVVYSATNYIGLVLLDLKTNENVKLTEMAGAGYDPVFDVDENIIYYRTDEFIQNRKFSSIVAQDLKSKKTKTILSKQRGMSTPKLINGQLVYTSDDKMSRTRVKEAGKVRGNEKDIFVDIDNQKIALYTNGIKKILAPKGEGNYIWPRLSPDKTKLLFTYAGFGTFVCNLDGKILSDLGYINSPNWLNNEYVIGMDDKDDHEKVTSSDILLVSAKGDFRKKLTDTPKEIEMYPTCSQNNKITYHTEKGDIYLMTIEIQ